MKSPSSSARSAVVPASRKNRRSRCDRRLFTQSEGSGLIVAQRIMDCCDNGDRRRLDSLRAEVAVASALLHCSTQIVRRPVHSGLKLKRKGCRNRRDSGVPLRRAGLY